jgi:hypothetical protein
MQNFEIKNAKMKKNFLLQLMGLCGLETSICVVRAAGALLLGSRPLRSDSWP